MTPRSMPDEFAAAWQGNQAYLLNLAVRILGNHGDAEDVVQEAFSRLADADMKKILDVRGWLIVVVTRICVDLLRSATSRHELPGDPVEMDTFGSRVHPRADPADRISLDEEVQLALLVVLQRLGPAERVAFILHDVFGMPFDLVAETLGRPVGTCRQLARRARHKLAGAEPDAGRAREHRKLTRQFVAACAGGDIDSLLATLHPDAWGVATFLSGAMAAQTNRGRAKVAASLATYFGTRAQLVQHTAMGKPAILAFIDGKFFGLLTLTVDDGLVTRIDATIAPGS